MFTKDTTDRRQALFGGAGEVRVWNLLGRHPAPPFAAVLACELDPGGSVGRHKQSTYNEIYDNRVDAGSALLVNAGCDNNRIYRNDFLRGRASSHAYNRWQSMSDEGNFWSNYSGEDADGDGFGDSIYRLLGATYEYDYRPAMTPYYQDEDG